MNSNHDTFISLNPNPLVSHLGKLPRDFTKEDLVRYFKDKDVKMINLCHVAEDSRLKTLTFAIHNEAHLNEILNNGERVDGSSLFSYINHTKSDIRIKPQINKAFANTFNVIPTINVMCSYLDEKSEPLDISPECILKRAGERLLKNTGIALKVLCELEFYAIARLEKTDLYPGTPQRNYQESSPFIKFEQLRNEVLSTLAACGIPVKYGHAEVGMFEDKNTIMEQHEVELQLESPEEMADHISIAKWVIRNLGAKHNVEVSFAPKVSLNHAGTGLHVHVFGMRNNESIMTDANEQLSNDAISMIGGLLKFAPTMTAFGNRVPTSYLRLVPEQEAPSNVCWGYENREALIRVPLGTCSEEAGKRSCTQTFELRLPDGSANVYHLLAGILMAAEHGLSNREKAVQTANELLVEGSGFRRDSAKTLPSSCYQSAKLLEKHREYYEKGDVFPKRVIDGTIQQLKSYADENLKKMLADDEKTDQLIKRFIHCG